MRRAGKIRTVFAAVLCASLFAQRNSLAATPTAEEILTRVSKVVDPIKTWSMNVESTGTVDTTFNEPHAKWRNVAKYIRFDDRRAIESKLVEIVTGEPKQNDVVGASHTSIVDGYFITFYDTPNYPAKIALYAPHSAGFVSHALEATMPGATAMEGRLKDPDPVADALRKCADLKLSATAEIIDGVSCVVISGHDKYGALTLWCDAARGYIPLKMQVMKIGDDIFGREPVSHHQFLPNGKARAADSITYTADGYQYEMLGGALVATSCHFVERIDFGAVGHFSSIRDIKRLDINLKPDPKDDKLFTPQLNNGVTLSNQENLKEPYEWMDGKIIPYIPMPLKERPAKPAVSN